jgi:hypothetical protein
MLYRSTAVLCVLLGCSGCVGMDMTSGTPMTSADASSLVKGKTTRTEVEQRLGPPASITMTSDGRTMATYSYYKIQAAVDPKTYIPVVGLFVGGATGTGQTQTLIVTYGKSNRVEDYTYSQGGSTGQSQGWMNTHATPTYQR